MHRSLKKTVLSTRYYSGPKTISQTVNMTPTHKTSLRLHSQSDYSGTLQFLRKSQFRSLERQEAEQLCYEHIFMLLYNYRMIWVELARDWF